MAPIPKRTVATIKKLRDNIRITFETTKQWLENPTTRKTIRDLKRRISYTEERYAEYVSLNEELLVEDEAETGDEGRVVEGLYLELISALETTLDELDDTTDDNRSVAGSEYRSCVGDDLQTVRLPKLRLPEFRGKAEEWTSFYQRFSSGMRSSKLTNLDRFQYLADCLKDDAAKVIANIPVLEENYDIAIELLRRRYENKRLNLRLNLRNLFSLPTAATGNSSALRDLVNVSLSTVRAIENLGYKRDTLANELVTQLIISKLDSKTCELWETEQTKITSTVKDKITDDDADNDSYNELMQFLEARLQVISSVYPNSTSKAPVSSSVVKPKTKTVMVAAAQSSTSTSSTQQPTDNSTQSPSMQSRTCSLCKGTHALYQCPTFHAQSVDERYQTVRRLHLCVNCFSNKHWANVCNSTMCKKCAQRHHTLLHNPSNGTSVDQSSTSSAAAAVRTTIATTPVTTSSSNSVSGDPAASAAAAAPTRFTTAVTQRQISDVLLATAMVNATSGSTTRTVTVLLDGASHISLIAKELQEFLNLKPIHIHASISGVGSVSTVVNQRANITVHSRTRQPFSINVPALVVDKIAEPLPTRTFDTYGWEFLNGYELADQQFNMSKKIDLLIGADLLYDILLPEIHRTAGGPALQASHFGWLLIGPYTAAETPTSVHVRCHATLAKSEIAAVSQFLGINDLPRAKERRTVEEMTCENFFIDTYQRDPVSGRFIVKLPLHSNKTVGDSRKLALARLQRTRITEEYREFLRDYEALGHMSRCAPPEPNTLTYYIPHHAVYHNNKIRVVFDASMKSTNGVSLNDCLLNGAILQPTLFEILLQFRTFKVAFTVDVSKMYRQILVSLTDRDLQRILLFEGDRLIDFQLNTVTYGTRAAPFLAIRCLMQLATDGEKIYPRAAEVLRKNTHVDDSLAGADTFDEAEQLKAELIALLRTAGMELSKWRSVSDPEDPKPLCDTENGRALGVHWNTTADSFSFPSLSQFTTGSGQLTRRSALSQVSKIFDPLGYLAPVSIVGKLLIQELWCDEVGWDDPVSEEFQQRFKNFICDTVAAASLSFPRFVGSSSMPTFELHGFADASKKAYAACVYSRFISDDQSIVVRLVASKTRVAPQRQPRTIPELELCAAALLVDLLNSVTQTIKHSINECHAYSDSTIVLAYLAKDSTHWVPYVANRVRRITASIPADRWKHIPGEENPADIATRVQSFTELEPRMDLWQHGPGILHNSGNMTPPTLLSCVTQASPIMSLAASVRPVPQANDLTAFEYVFHRFSQYNRCQRAIGYVFRFIDILRSRIRKTEAPTGPLTATELTRAKFWLVKLAQATAFTDSLRQIQNQKPLKAKSRLNSLSPFVQDGLLRVGGRITRAEVPYDQRHPVILPANHRLTLLLIRDCHFKNYHAGPQYINAFLRRSYWFIGDLSSQIQKIIRRCARCQRFRRNAYRTPPMADLPEDRVRPSSPFAISGVDYAGPFTRKPEIRARSATKLKTYVAIFVCFSTRAVHIEVVNDLSTVGFLAALRRFSARRGAPTIIYSDNGTNFVGAANELHKRFNELANSPEVQTFAFHHPIQWNFNPPAAPHMGGLWESAVRIMKFHLYRTIGSAILTGDEFSTLMCEIESIMNSRPIAPLEGASNNPDALTPGHFLIGRPLTAIPDYDIAKVRYPQRWALVSQLRNLLWQRWRDEVLASLQKRVKWTVPARNFKVNDIVILSDEMTPPLMWPLGRIICTYPDKHGVVRSVDILSRNGSRFNRPVHKLIPLVDVDEISTSTPTTSTSTAAGCLP